MRYLSQCCWTSQSPELGYKIPRDLGTCRASVEAGASTSYKIQRHRRCRPLKQRASDAGLKMPWFWKTEFLIHPCSRNHQEFCGRGAYPQIRKWCRAKGMTGTPSMNWYELCKTQTNRKVHCRIKMISENEKTSSWMRSCVHDLFFVSKSELKIGRKEMRYDTFEQKKKRT